MKYLKINVKNAAYSAKDILNNHRTMTVRDLIDCLEDLSYTVGEDAKVVLSFDNGYSYGSLTESRVKAMEMDTATGKTEELW